MTDFLINAALLWYLWPVFLVVGALALCLIVWLAVLPFALAVYMYHWVVDTAKDLWAALGEMLND